MNRIIDKNRKNNLLFYGVVGDESDPDECEARVKQLLAVNFRISREIPLIRVARVNNGPSFRGVKPVLVTFQVYKVGKSQ